jgi:hypothetical protein
MSSAWLSDMLFELERERYGACTDDLSLRMAMCFLGTTARDGTGLGRKPYKFLNTCMGRALYCVRIDDLQR